ncbi:hypothetical protein ACFYY3_25480 [Streptomyces sp. NPDC001812]|uniref:Large catalase C-terminal domain-containing protein n=1 Tax=Streptomyces cathayae TaxID=3031124 RepID=A0ABY8JWY8_9ACTN|nr:hypothetical protein [Streptomyces sp. HUAS 5]WGD38843.1 hypothetical protein PYS65_00930 [Streptomyces sp. HUAS 5]
MDASGAARRGAAQHGTAIGAWTGGGTALEAAGVPTGAPGTAVAGSGSAALEQVGELLGSHRVRERFGTRSDASPSRDPGGRDLPTRRGPGHRRRQPKALTAW